MPDVRKFDLVEPFKDEVLETMADRIMAEVDGVNRVVYDISKKPSATIEWE